MSIEKYLKKEINIHPHMQPQDIVKLCYQAAYGSEHLIKSKDEAKAYLRNECSCLISCDTELIENISDDICRISLNAWMNNSLPIGWLLELFFMSSNENIGSDSRFKENIAAADKIISNSNLDFTHLEWTQYLDEYMKKGIHAVHHSDKYRTTENPAYRIINRKFTYLIPLLIQICTHKKNSLPYIIAIDGRCASGKTTTAKYLSTVINADVIHMDDFFLPPSKRTASRLQESGGNVDYERFSDEVISSIHDLNGFQYKKYNCHMNTLNELQSIGNRPFRIVEGSYSTHPYFGKYADITVFIDIDPCIQLNRIIKRNGEEMAVIFKNRWIPLEEKYFNAFGTKEKADIIL